MYPDNTGNNNYKLFKLNDIKYSLMLFHDEYVVFAIKLVLSLWLCLIHIEVHVKGLMRT